MPQMEFTEILVLSITAIIRVGIPVAVAVWIIQCLRRIRSENEAIKSKLESIEQQLRHDSRSRE